MSAKTSTLPPAPSSMASNDRNINLSAPDRAAHGPGNSNLANPASASLTNGANAGLSRNSSVASASHAHHHYHHHQPQAPPPAAQQRNPAVDSQTLSNTLANSHVSSPPHETLHIPNRQPKFTEEWDASVRGSSIIDGLTTHSRQQPDSRPKMQRSSSVASHRSEVITGDASSAHNISLSRGNTLKKKNSLRKSGSIKRSGSRRSMKAGSVRSLALQSSHGESDETHSAFHCPVPTSGNPTEILASRFQAWRKILKDLIAYFREIQSHYEQRSKSLLKLANVLNNTSTPPGFLASGGLDDALQILRDYHKTAIVEANKAREIEEDVILALTGLRSDLNQKMKEIKSLSGDFKNSVEKEMDGTRRAVNALQEILGQSELDSSMTTGKQDPYLLRLAVDRQVEKQLDEENYLHQAYLNLETSGRELESIVVGEIQKSYNAYAGILKRESDAAYNAIDELRVGPIAMPKDYEWVSFIQRDSQFVDPEIPVRSAEHIHYPGRDHFACQEIRAGLLERKSKYLKSYTAGWYVLSPTHLHEFKSADKTQAPVMSLYLPEQKLGSHSTEGGSSNKFIIKGRQTGSMHRGHTWVFRAESHDTMMAWYEDIKALTEKTPEELSNLLRGNHARSLSRSSQRSYSSDGINDDEDEEPYAPNAAIATPGSRDSHQNRPEPGGRFPSDLEVTAQRGLQVPLSPSSSNSAVLSHEYSMQGGGTNAYPDHDVIAAAANQPGSGVGDNNYAGNRNHLTVGQSYGNTPSVIMDEAPSHGAIIEQQARQDGVNPYTGEPTQPQRRASSRLSYVAGLDTVTTSRMREPSQDSSYLASSTASPVDARNGSIVQQPAAVGQGIPIQLKEQTQPMGSGNGFAKAAPVADVPVYIVPGGQGRPVNPRTSSTPHVPGEYPRSSVGGTPGAY